MGHVRRGVGENVMRALGRVRRGDERGWTAGWGKRWGEVLYLEQCGAVADAARCDGRCSAVRWPMQRGATWQAGLAEEKKDTMQYL